jgi:hypothetical protein
MYEIGVDSRLDSSVEQRKEMAIAPSKKTNNKVIMVFKKSGQKYEKCTLPKRFIYNIFELLAVSCWPMAFSY